MFEMARIRNAQSKIYRGGNSTFFSSLLPPLSSSLPGNAPALLTPCQRSKNSRSKWVARDGLCDARTVRQRGPSPIRHGAGKGQAGVSIIEMLLGISILIIFTGMVFQSFSQLYKVTGKQTMQSDTTSKARGAMERVAQSLRDDLVEFNAVSGTPLGVNFDLNDTGDNPVVRDGILYYFDENHTAQLYDAGSGQVATAGLDDASGDGLADVIGIGLVRQDLNGDGIQDFIDLNNDGVADDLDGDGNPDPLWALTLVHFNNINDVSTASLWLNGQVLATNLYIRRLDAMGPLSAYNIDTFQFSAHNPIAMLYDTAAYGGDQDTIVEEDELGNMKSADGIINDPSEVSAIDSITITLHIAEISHTGKRSIVLSDISSDLITPRLLQLIRQNGIVGLPDPTLAGNIN